MNNNYYYRVPLGMSLLARQLSRTCPINVRSAFITNYRNISQNTDNISLLSHYSQKSQVFQRIIDGFAAKKKDMSEVTIEDLSLVDEFHIGGIVSAKQLFSQLNIKEYTQVLDIGAGIGGPSRLCAHTMNCSVIGIDITPEYVSVGNVLSALPKVSVKDKVQLIVDDACSLSSIESESMDTAFMLHVGMNIKDKNKCADQIFRVLKPGGMLGIFDVTVEEGINIETDLNFPLPFASSTEHCFLSTNSQYREIFEETGFEIIKETDKHGFVKEALSKVLSKIPVDKVPPLSLAVVMGPNFRNKLSNCLDLVSSNKLGAVELILKKPT